MAEIMMDYNIQVLMVRRTSKEITKLIQLLKIPKTEHVIHGSYSRFLKGDVNFFGDIDFYQVIPISKQTIRKIKDHIKKMIMKLPKDVVFFNYEQEEDKIKYEIAFNYKNRYLKMTNTVVNEISQESSKEEKLVKKLASQWNDGQYYKMLKTLGAIYRVRGDSKFKIVDKYLNSLGHLNQDVQTLKILNSHVGNHFDKQNVKKALDAIMRRHKITDLQQLSNSLNYKASMLMKKLIS